MEKRESQAREEVEYQKNEPGYYYHYSMLTASKWQDWRGNHILRYLIVVLGIREAFGGSEDCNDL